MKGAFFARNNISGLAVLNWTRSSSYFISYKVLRGLTEVAVSDYLAGNIDKLLIYVNG